MSLFADIVGYNSAGRAAKAISTQYDNAQQGVIRATNSGQDALQGQIARGYTDVNHAGDNVNNAAVTANATLGDYLKGIQGNLAPSIESGAQGNKGLQDYAASNPQFNFDPAKYFNSPGYQFQLEQGTNAITNNASAQGLGASGNTAKALEQYGQGLGATYYNNAFNQAQSEFQTNQNTTLSNLQALISSGNVGNTLNNQAVMGLGGQQATNTVNAANTNADLQKLLASLGIQGQEFGANFGLQGNKIAGDYAIGKGNAQAAGITGQGAALSNGAADLASLLFGGGTLGPASSMIFGGKA